MQLRYKHCCIFLLCTLLSFNYVTRTRIGLLLHFLQGEEEENVTAINYLDDIGWLDLPALTSIDYHTMSC